MYVANGKRATTGYFLKDIICPINIICLNSANLYVYKRINDNAWLRDESYCFCELLARYQCLWLLKMQNFEDEISLRGEECNT